MAKNVIIRNNENTEIICSEVDTIILPTADGGTASFKDWNGIDKGSNIKTDIHSNNTYMSADEKMPIPFLVSQIKTPSTDYMVETVSGASYGFSLRSDGYYESTNKGIHNSYALCKIKFTTDGLNSVKILCISDGESSHDYGVLSTLDQTLTLSTSDSTNIKQSFQSNPSTSPRIVDYGIPSAGDHFIYAKFRKDGSSNSGNDSLRFMLLLF